MTILALPSHLIVVKLNWEQYSERHCIYNAITLCYICIPMVFPPLDWQPVCPDQGEGADQLPGRHHSSWSKATKSLAKAPPAETQDFRPEITSQWTYVDGRKMSCFRLLKVLQFFLQGNYLYKILFLLSRILSLMKPYFEHEIVTKEKKLSLSRKAAIAHTFDGLNRIFLF